MIIGVLALQGGFAKHISMLKRLHVQAIEVRTLKELEQCHGLIIPGGESTVITRHLDLSNLRQQLLDFAKKRPVFGTCAGLILMSKTIMSSSLVPLGLLDVVTQRNAYGRQAASFETSIELTLKDKQPLTVPAVFIRAPRLSSFSNTVHVLAKDKEEAVFVQQGFHLGATFHPELTSNDTIHRYFLELVQQHI